nr:hypothetical protein [Marinicella sp. W31]MDC2877643.1 hypothetical protein [Marinicella sp. W31]
MERELQMAVSRPQQPKPQAQRPEGVNMQPKSQIFAAETDQAPRQQRAAPAPQQAPQQPRQQMAEPRRMPEVSDFPPVVQPEMSASRRQEQEERGPKGLFKRLSNTLGRGDESFEGHHEQPAPRQQAPQAAPQNNPYAPRRSAEQPAARQDDDQFDIPAFLRRQAN